MSHYIFYLPELSTTVLLWHGFTWYVNHCHVQTQRERRKTLPCISRGKRYVNLCHVSACNQYQNLRKLLYDQHREFFQSALAFVSELSLKTHRHTPTYARLRVSCSNATRLLNSTDLSTWFQMPQMAPDSTSEHANSWGSMPPDPLPNCSLAPPPL